MTATVETPAGAPAEEVSPESDFLFHLYRGSELLHDSRLLEARSELEVALMLRPLDARTQGLLAGVYFRTGHYQLAVTTYRNLRREHPEDPTLRLNLALCYLKTGDSPAARALLEALVVEDVTDVRAWGYLAVVLERLGYLDQAREAFERAGQPDLAERMVARGASKPRRARAGTTESTPVREHEPLPDEEHTDEVALATRRGTGVRHQAFEELDAGALNLDIVRSVPPESGARDGLADATLASASFPPPVASFVPPRLETLAWGGRVPAAPTRPLAWLDAPTLTNFIEDARLERLGQTRGVTLLGTRLARIELAARDDGLASGFAFRLESLRSYTGTLEGDILRRQSRPQTIDPPPNEGGSAASSTTEPAGETFGGIGTPFGSLREPGHLLLAPKPSLRLQAFTLENEVVFFREEAMVGFDLSLHYENGRLGVGGLSGDASPVVQLRGSGTLLLELASELLAIEVRDAKGAGATVRKEVVVGWVGRLLPRLLSADEAPCGQRGLVGFSGEGTVLVTAK